MKQNFRAFATDYKWTSIENNQIRKRHIDICYILGTVDNNDKCYC
jgi:hypothetical protein